MEASRLNDLPQATERVQGLPGHPPAALPPTWGPREKAVLHVGLHSSQAAQ